MAVLVTGGAGMIGSNIVRRLTLQCNEQVVVLDRVGKPAGPSPFEGTDSRVTFVVGGVSDPALLRKTIADHDVKYIVHMAAMIAGDATAHPVEAMEVNVMGTTHVLEAAREANLRRVVVFSASAVMGGPEDTTTPRSEDEIALPATGIYTITKFTAEQLVNCYRDLYGVDAVAIRPRAVYGPGTQQASYIQPIPALIWAAVKGEDVVKKSGADTRTNLTYAKDVAAGIVRLLRHPATLPNYVYNVNSGETVSLGDVAAILQELFPRQKFELGPGLAEGVLAGGSQRDLTWRMIERPPHLIDRARKDFGLNPTWLAPRGIRDYVRWLKTGEYGDFD